MQGGTTVDANDLVEIEAIKRLKYKYFRCLDLKLWDEMPSCFTPEATVAYSGGRYSAEGIEAIMDFLTGSMSSEEFLSSHRCHHPEIDLTGADSATGIWAFDDFVIIGEFDIIVAGAGFYEDHYAKHGGEWLIEHTGYRRSFEQVIPRASIEGIALTASWWGTNGQSELPAG